MYVIIGASGFLGSYLIKNILDMTEENILATCRHDSSYLKDNPRVEWQEVDVCRKEHLTALDAKMERGAKVIYLAAYHHPDKVEENPGEAWNTNIVALAETLNVLTKAACFYYSSTDSVYGEGGMDRRFAETDPANPVNLYGKHKALAEQIVLAHGGNVIRFPFIIGPSLVPDRPHFFDKIKQDLLSGKQVEMFEDSYRSALDFNQCAGLLITLIEKYGACAKKIVNIAGDASLSKYDVACLIADRFGLNKGLIKPVSIKSAQQIFKARRAATVILDNTIIKELIGVRAINIQF